MALSLVSHRSFLILIFLYYISFHSNHPLSQVLDPIQAIPISAVPTSSANSPSSSPSASSPSAADNTPSASPSPSPTNAASSPTNAPSSPANNNSPSPSPSPSLSLSPSPSPSPGPVNSPSASSNGASPSPSKTGSQSASPNSPSGSPAPAPSSTVVIITLTRTAADGSLYASITSTLTPLPHSTSTPGSSSSSGSSSSTWAIIGGIVGGLAALGALVFIVFRCTQRRFSDLDDEDVAIKWPELVNRADDPSTLNPLAARPALGHGVGEDDDHEDEKPRLYSHDIAMESLHSDQRHPRMYDPYQPYHPPPLHQQEQNAYLDDPYLGPSATQPPYPATVNNLGYDEMGVYQSQPSSRPNDIQSRPSISSSISRAHDLRSPSPSQHRAQLNNYHDHLQQQYPISWDGPEDIPLTVVNSSSNPTTTPSPAQNHHRP